MSYLALYREWRPRRFAEMSGQEHVRRVLVNALLRDKVAHAYLFSGPRGTGKTTAAKILAKAVNCGARQGAEPCNECVSCREIDQGVSLDVYEIDAASNRGIDEVRDLREKVRLAPAGGRNKVYIIDEVHMMTKEAFNALLKTLEEPPAGVVFILATTEAHKVPLTILSRVQRFSFHRLADHEIVARLAEVCRAGGREVGADVLGLIAAKSEGGLRDALSLLDQCLLVEGELLPEHVYGILGAAGEEYIADLTDDLLKKDYAAVLQRLADGVALGRDPRQLIRELLEYLRRLLLYLAGGEQPLLPAGQLERLKTQAAATDLPRLLAMLDAIMKGEAELKYASNANLAADMILVTAMGTAPAAPAAVNAAGRAGRTPGNAGRLSGDAGPAPAAAAAAAGRPRRAGFGSQPKPSPPPAAANKPAPQPGPGGAVPSAPSLETVRALWPALLEEVRKKKISTHAFLQEGAPAAWEDGVLYLAFRDGYTFHRDKFTQPENKNVVEEILSRLLNQAASLRSVLESELPPGAAFGATGGVEETAPGSAAPSASENATVGAAATERGGVGEKASDPSGSAATEGAEPDVESVAAQARRMRELFGEGIVRVTD
ncbi:MAG: DNA polymerase III subunit gamma/tau [Gracilibacteraceae bacterium]|jgi:DNA polymerase-3 subunit gamma/tau|nr:DNA polymerase III subunit gamma/tau [Gracilibacteraceae bacterium]